MKLGFLTLFSTKHAVINDKLQITNIEGIKIMNISKKSNILKKLSLKKLINITETKNWTRAIIRTNIYVEIIKLDIGIGAAKKNSFFIFSINKITDIKKDVIIVVTTYKPDEDQIIYIGLILTNTIDKGIEKNKKSIRGNKTTNMKNIIYLFLNEMNSFFNKASIRFIDF